MNDRNWWGAVTNLGTGIRGSCIAPSRSGISGHCSISEHCG